MLTKWVVFVMFSLLVIIVLGFVNGMFGVNEKTSMSVDVYECGIEPMQDEKTPFYLHFFLIGVLFLLFDVELIICIPLVFLFVYEKVWNVVWFFFFLVVFIGLVLEVLMGTFSWKE